MSNQRNRNDHRSNKQETININNYQIRRYNMPRGDRTGPAGMGPMTGRGAGFCAGYSVPGYANPVGGRGYGSGFGRGGGRGRGGWGFRNRFFATGIPGWQATVGAPLWGAPQPYSPTKDQEIEMLKGQSQFLEDELSGIRKRLQELESEDAGK
jgi:hypothetical protein